MYLIFFPGVFLHFWNFLSIFLDHLNCISIRSFVPDCGKFLSGPPGPVVHQTKTKLMLQSRRHHHCQWQHGFPHHSPKNFPIFLSGSFPNYLHAGHIFFKLDIGEVLA